MQMFLGRPVLDDRNRKVRGPGSNLGQWIYLNAQQRAKTFAFESVFGDNVAMAVVALVVGGAVWYFASWEHAIIAIILMMAPRPGILGARAQHSAATLVMLGRCGSCGYQLDGLTPETDNAVVCPECGSAWQHRRLTQRNRDLWPPSYPERGVLDPSGPDDRGVLTLIHIRRTIPIDSWSAGKAIEIASAQKWKQMLHIGAPIAFLVLLTFVIGVGLAWEPLLAVIGAFFFVLATIPLLNRPPSTKFRRDAFLELGLCPCCLRAVDKDLAQDDGCVVCDCGSAWRAADVTSDRVLCRHCSYDMTGVPSGECPECGASKVSRWQPREVGHPYCARCGKDMLGREKRTCDDCGAMYGLEYRDR